MELYRKHRPRDFDGIVGQQAAVTMLEDMLGRNELPHVLLFSGPSGCGKTTLARILRRKLQCSAVDFHEVNAAKDRGIDLVRQISSHMGLAPLAGDCRIWLIDEAAQMTPQAQDSFLKILEDTPQHVYFMLATTDPHKLKRTIITRSTELKVQALTVPQLLGLLAVVAGREGFEMSDEVADAIAAAADGSARKALVLLHQVAGIGDEDERLEAVARADAKARGDELCRTMMRPRCGWADLAKILGDADEEPETLRRMVLGYMTKVALNGKGAAVERAAWAIECFRDDVFASGLAGVVAACWEFLHRDGGRGVQ